VAALGGGLAPALIYLLFNRGATARGWSVPTATDMAFVLAVLALLGTRIPSSLRVFVAAFAVVDDILSVLTLAIFYPRNFEAWFLFAAVAAIFAMYLLNRSRVYSIWPYVLVSTTLWFFLHSAGVHGALAGVVLAAFVPTRPSPDASPLLAQAANALAALEHAQAEAKASMVSDDELDPVLEWASRNLSAASERLLSPADRLELAVAPWSTYLALPLFAFSATGVSFDVDLSSPDVVKILLGVVLGLVLGKPMGILLTSFAAVRVRIARIPKGVGLRAFIGAACLCGIGDTVALLMADQAFPTSADAAVAKIGVLIGSVLAAGLGAAIIASGPGADIGDKEETSASGV
jgi:Na+:H+ antiporter, NhaA family